MENIDDEADQYGIDFVKNDEALAAKQYSVYHTPALVYFRKKVPIVYDGDLHDEERVSYSDIKLLCIFGNWEDFKGVGLVDFARCV